MTQPEVINELQRAMVGGEQHLLELIPVTLRRVITDRIWADCLDRKGERFASFEAFAAAPLWHGLACSIDDLLAYCRKRADIQALIRAEVELIAKPGAPQGNDNAAKERYNKGNNVTFDRGNSSTYTLRRLKRDRPDLADQVAKGSLSANAAAIAAGFRARSISVPLHPEKAAATLRRHFTADQLQRLQAALAGRASICGGAA